MLNMLHLLETWRTLYGCNVSTDRNRTKLENIYVTQLRRTTILALLRAGSGNRSSLPIRRCFTMVSPLSFSALNSRLVPREKMRCLTQTKVTSSINLYSAAIAVTRAKTLRTTNQATCSGGNRELQDIPLNKRAHHHLTSVRLEVFNWTTSHKECIPCWRSLSWPVIVRLFIYRIA